MVATSTTPGGSVVGPATSQLQARLSQPPAAPGNREQLRYLLQRGPGNPVPASEAAIPQTSAMTSVVAASVASSASAAAPGVTTTKVWVPGEVLENLEMHTMLKVKFLFKKFNFFIELGFSNILNFCA